MALIPPHFMDTVVAIGIEVSNRKAWIGTGFLYAHFLEKKNNEENTYRTYLVTNRHVVEGAIRHKDRVVLRFNPIQGDLPAKEFDLILKDSDGKPQWIEHDDPDIDLALILINTSLLQDADIKFHCFQSDSNIATREEAAKIGITEGDHVYILGYPMELIGEKRNFVIIRHGTIARIRDALSGFSKEFLVDGFVFPGNSGGPVVTRPEGVGIEGTSIVQESFLIGIVSNYIHYTDIAVSQQTGQHRITFTENSGLAGVIPIDFVEEIAAKHREQIYLALAEEGKKKK